MDAFFGPVELSLSLNRARGKSGLMGNADTYLFNRVFRPVIEHNASVSSVLMADDTGNENMLLSMGGGHYVGRNTGLDQDGILVSTTTQWDQEGEELVPQADPAVLRGYDPVARPWFQAALQGSPDSVHWTAPYRFFTTKEPGITASVRWEDRDGHKHVLAYDVLLSDVSEYLYIAHPSANGKAFLFSGKDRLLGLTEDDRFTASGLRDSTISFDLDEMNLPEVIQVREQWRSLKHLEDGFAVDLDGERWGAMIVPYQLGDQVLKIGVMIPEGDVLARVRTSRIMLSLAGLVLMLFGAMIIRMLRSTSRVRSTIAEQNAVLARRTLELSESLTYVKYLQDATLPSSGTIQSWFSESFVFNRPKEHVGGDLYWMEPVEQRVLFAVADCTGHGVPGALVSMACTNALDRSVRELRFTAPAEILETNTQFVMEAFQRNPTGLTDGMDICLCSLRYFRPVVDGKQADGAFAELDFAGANRPLWILRKATGEV